MSSSQHNAEVPVAETDEDDDDFGEFEDATVSTTAKAAPTPNVASGGNDASPGSKPNKLVKPFPPKAAPPKPKTKNLPPEPKDKTGQHPFAGRMDFLFEAGDDEYDAGTDELADLSNNPEAAMAYSKRIIAEQEAAQAKHKDAAPTPPKPLHTRKVSEPKPARNKLKKKSGYVPAKDPNVLFDADNVSDHEDDGDDFGDFESFGAPVATIQHVSRPNEHTTVPDLDLLGLDDTMTSHSTTNGDAHIVPSQSRRSHSSSIPRGPDMDPLVSSHPPPSTQEDEDWDDFEDSAPTDLPTQHSPPKVSPHPPKPSESDNILPPTNIPPPVVLLSLFPPLFASADNALFDTMSKLDLKQRQMLLAHPASHQFLKGYLGHIAVLARIIAGRKLRWKRDQRLSQSMRIGPASGSGGGMKLTGLDKSEVAREDREVLDTLRLYKTQIGKLRAAVTSASTTPSTPKLGPVPEISETMPIKSLKPTEAGIVAPHACALCGLKREERIAKVDVEIEDSFGEWWIQSASMHLGCWRFWGEFEGKLKSR